MGRPYKIGLDFYSIDIDMDEDDKIIDLLEDLGSLDGMGALYFLLNAIYKNGYYIEWNDSVLKKLCRKKHLDRESLKTAIDLLTGRTMNHQQLKENPTFFDNKMFREYGILTSKGIQERYAFACQRRKNIYFDQKYILLSYQYGDITKNKKNSTGNYETSITGVGHFLMIDGKQLEFSFINNGIITDNNNPDNVDINDINVNTNTSQNEGKVNVNINSFNAYNNPQREKKGKKTEKEREKKEKRKQAGTETPDSFPPSFSSYTPKPSASDFDTFEPNTDRQRFLEIKKHWKQCENLPQSKLLDTNMNIGHEALDMLKVFPNEDICKAIDNYNLCFSKIEPKYRIKSFSNFMTSERIEVWISEAAVEEYYPKERSETQKEIDKLEEFLIIVKDTYDSEQKAPYLEKIKKLREKEGIK